MNYNYQSHDNIFNIKSMNNLFIDIHYFPANHMIVIYYLSDVKGYRDFNKVDSSNNPIKLLITKQMLKNNRSLRNLSKDRNNPLKIIFRNLTRPVNLARYCHFWGLTPTRNAALNYMNAKGQIHPVTDRALAYAYKHHSRPRAKWVSEDEYNRKLLSGEEYNGAESLNMVTPYYTVKRTDPKYDKKKYGITMGFNSDNYDLTMIATFLGYVVHNNYARNYMNDLCNQNSRLAKEDWTVPNNGVANQERSVLINRILKPEFIYYFNNELFTTYKRSMPQLLENLPNIQQGSGESFFEKINNPAYNIYKGWITSNRYLNIANLNEHMKDVSFEQIAATKGWSINEPKVISNELSNLDQIADLIGCYSSNVQIIKQIFELSRYQNSLTLRRYLFKKYPQLTYTFKLRPALIRFYKRTAKHIDDSNLNSVEKINAINKISGIKKVLHSKHSFYMYKYYKKARSVANPHDVDIRPNTLRFDQLTINDNLARIISNIVAPYQSIQDWPSVQFIFPDPRVLKNYQVKHPNESKFLPKKPFNVLDETMHWAKNIDKKYGLTKFSPANENTIMDKNHSVAKTFFPIYKFYKRIEGLNVNNKLIWMRNKMKLYNIFGRKENIGPNKYTDKVTGNKYSLINLLHMTNTNIPYLHRNGTETGTIVRFDCNSIRGTETALVRYKMDYKKFLNKKRIIDYCRKRGLIPDEIGREQIFLYKGQAVSASSLLNKSGGHFHWQKIVQPRLYNHKAHYEYTVNGQYNHISNNSVSHVSFNEYYPNLISHEGIMWPHGESQDIYGQMCKSLRLLKQKRSDLSKDSKLWKLINDEKSLYELLLNSILHSKYSERIENKLTSLRIISQLFTWQVGQAECLANQYTKVVSTNSRGLYIQGLPYSNFCNNKLLQKLTRPWILSVSTDHINHFVTKDADNQIGSNNYNTFWGNYSEIDVKGAALKNWLKPSITTKITHPMIIDYGLVRYLASQSFPCNRPVNIKELHRLVDIKRNELLSTNSVIRQDGLLFFQWIITGNPNTHRYPYIRPEKLSEHNNILGLKWSLIGHVITLPLISRVFLMKSPVKNKLRYSLSLATRQKIQPKTFRIWKRDNRLPKNDPDVLHIFHRLNDHSLPNYVTYNHMYYGRRAKLRNIPVHQNVLVESRALNEVPLSETIKIEKGLDYDVYINLIIKEFNNSWHNFKK